MAAWHLALLLAMRLTCVTAATPNVPALELVHAVCNATVAYCKKDTFHALAIAALAMCIAYCIIRIATRILSMLCNTLYQQLPQITTILRFLQGCIVLVYSVILVRYITTTQNFGSFYINWKNIAAECLPIIYNCGFCSVGKDYCYQYTSTRWCPVFALVSGLIMVVFLETLHAKIEPKNVKPKK